MLYHWTKSLIICIFNSSPGPHRTHRKSLTWVLMSLRFMKRCSKINFTCASLWSSHNYYLLIKCKTSLIIFPPLRELRIPSLPKDVMLFNISWGFLFFCFFWVWPNSFLIWVQMGMWNKELRQSCTCLLTQTTQGLDPVEAEVVAKVRWTMGEDLVRVSMQMLVNNFRLLRYMLQSLIFFNFMFKGIYMCLQQKLSFSIFA